MQGKNAQSKNRKKIVSATKFSRLNIYFTGYHRFENSKCQNVISRN